jgi:type IV secretory pathway VirB10-like protein
MQNETQQTPTEDPQLTQRAPEPKGVIRKNIKMFVYLGAIALLIVASLFSSKKKPGSVPAKGTPPQPFVQDNTANNVADLQNQLATEKQKQLQDQQMAAALAAAQTPAQQMAANQYAANGQPTVPPPQPYQQGQSPNGQPQLSPEQQQIQQLAGKEREIAFNSRFASNLVYNGRDEEEKVAQSRQTQNSGQMMQAPASDPYSAAVNGGQGSSLTAARAAGEKPVADTTGAKRAPEVNVDAAVGQPYVIFEGTTLDTVLMNRLDGDAPGPVKVLVSNPFYSHDHQHVLIPDGTIVLGEAKKIGASGFGQQRRMAVVFHRLIMPDGFSVDLDQFHGLDQIGQEGLKDKVNNHYLQIFGTSIALGVIAGAGEIESGGGTISTSGSQAFTTGAAGSVSQTSTAILDKFIQIPPTITIREGHRVKVYFTQDMLVPAYTNHTIPQTF